jgi:hypothetical protein
MLVLSHHSMAEEIWSRAGRSLSVTLITSQTSDYSSRWFACTFPHRCPIVNLEILFHGGYHFHSPSALLSSGVDHQNKTSMIYSCLCFASITSRHAYQTCRNAKPSIVVISNVSYRFHAKVCQWDMPLTGWPCFLLLLDLVALCPAYWNSFNLSMQVNLEDNFAESHPAIALLVTDTAATCMHAR